ncbi:MAG: leucine-rich repeat domain-containing protein [Clostridia bacterium]|nr:leucine-rich repeat domain-containing protein [Clostridia bacterium]
MEENKDNVMNTQNTSEVPSSEEVAATVVDVTDVLKEDVIQIKDEEVWTYQVPGLAAPRIGKPIKYKLLKQIVLVAIIVIAVMLAIYFSIAAVQKDTFEFATLEQGVELTKFNNTGYIKELYVDYSTEIKYTAGDSNPETNFYFVKDESKPVVSIREYAFNCDEKLEVVYVGANVKSIDGKSFYTCNALERIEVDEANEYYCDVNGVLYNKDMTELICYPIKHSKYVALQKGYGEDISEDSANYQSYVQDVLTYKIPLSVTKIGMLSFNYTDIKYVYISESVKTIDSMAFFRGESLEEIISYKADGGEYKSLPNGVEYLGSDAFSYCQSLDYMFIPKSVTYIGHHAFWDTVYKEDGALKGVTAMYIEREEKDFKKNVKAGDQWRPKYDFLLFKKNVDTHYGAQRQA